MVLRGCYAHPDQHDPPNPHRALPGACRRPLSMKTKIALLALLAIIGLYFANKRFNSGTASRGGMETGKAAETARGDFTIGFLPVTCHLTCPVTSWVTSHSDEGTVFQAQRFGDFASAKEAMVARKIDACFLNAPIAMKLVADGIPCKIVYLGHRDGTAIVVPINSEYKEFKDLAGKKVAIPGRFSNQNILMRRMMKQNGMAPDSINLVEIPPPEHPGTLAAGAIDAYIIGEPHAAKAEIGGFGRVLFQAKDLWPNFISCVLVVRQEVIDERRPLVQELVDGIAASGMWLDADREQGANNRKAAAVVVGKMYYNQDPSLLEFVLTKPLDRVMYTDLVPPKDMFEEMMNYAVELEVLPKYLPFDAYCDVSFAPELAGLPPIKNFPMPTEAELAQVGK
jgi:NitT/TauT family transport system substrate-binding protein